MIRRLATELSALLREAARLLRARAGLLLVACAVTAAAVALLLNLDVECSRRIVSDRSDALVRIARGFSYWGDFFPGTVAVSAAIALTGAARRSRKWVRAGFACVIAATIASLAVNAVKVAAGRPRPWAEMADGFYGPRRETAFRSFPSGHSATSMATAGALAGAFPAAAVPAFACAAGVMWSRLYLHQHYPSDVVAGGMLGLVLGLALGAAARISDGREP